jgi:hypothetical protein
VHLAGLLRALRREEWINAKETLEPRRGACQPSPRSHGEQDVPIAHRAGVLFELAVFTAPTVEPDMHRAAITLRLAANAGPYSGQRIAARLRNFLTAFTAMGFCLTGRHTRPRSPDPVHDSIVDLILNRTFRCPPARHCRSSNSPDVSEHHIAMSAGHSKDRDRLAPPGATLPSCPSLQVAGPHFVTTHPVG